MTAMSKIDPIRNLLVVGSPAIFPVSKLPRHRSAAEAVFSLRASELQTMMDDAKRSCASLQTAYSNIESAAGKHAEVVIAGFNAVADLDKVNNQALRVGAIDTSAFEMLGAADRALLDTLMVFMQGALDQTDEALHKALDQARSGNSKHLPDLKTLCWQIEGVNRFWQETVRPRVELAAENLRTERKDVEAMRV